MRLVNLVDILKVCLREEVIVLIWVNVFIFKRVIKIFVVEKKIVNGFYFCFILLIM